MARDCTVEVPIFGNEIMWKRAEAFDLLFEQPRMASMVTSRPVRPVPPVEMMASISARLSHRMHSGELAMSSLMILRPTQVSRFGNAVGKVYRSIIVQGARIRNRQDRNSERE